MLLGNSFLISLEFLGVLMEVVLNDLGVVLDEVCVCEVVGLMLVIGILFGFIMMFGKWGFFCILDLLGKVLGSWFV